MKRILSLLCFIFLASALDLPQEDAQEDASSWWESKESVEAIHPEIKVQTVISEGLGWDKNSPDHETSNHIVITIAGSAMDRQIPYANKDVVIKSTGPLKCRIEQGNGHFEDCSFDKDESRIFKSNPLGRISFSIPMETQIKSFGDVLPTLLFQTEYMSDNEWYDLQIRSSNLNTIGL